MNTYTGGVYNSFTNNKRRFVFLCEEMKFYVIILNKTLHINIQMKTFIKMNNKIFLQNCLLKNYTLTFIFLLFLGNIYLSCKSMYTNEHILRCDRTQVHAARI